MKACIISLREAVAKIENSLGYENVSLLASRGAHFADYHFAFFYYFSTIMTYQNRDGVIAYISAISTQNTANNCGRRR